MFEKEAERYVIKKHNIDITKQPIDFSLRCEFSEDLIDFQKGAEFGYSQARKEMSDIGLALQSDMDKTIKQNLELKKENEELNYKVKELQYSCEGATMLYNDLKEAKEIIGELYRQWCITEPLAVLSEIGQQVQQFLDKIDS